MHVLPRNVPTIVGCVAGVLVGTADCCAVDVAKVGTLRYAFQSIRTQDLRKHATVLASDAFEGREAGSRGGRAAGAYLGNQLRKLELQGGGTNNSYYQEFGDEYRNVIARLHGSDPELKDEFIIVGAHYDHVGYGTGRNSFGPIGYIHNGADDNASGTAAILEIIEAFATLKPQPKRSILFIFWDAEEKGLLGSRYWIEHPTIPLSRLRLTITADMLGRLRQDRLDVFGSRTARGLRRLVSEQNIELKLIPNFTWEMRADSDHYPFVVQHIPSLMLHTGKHEDYHRPSDDVEKLKIDGIQRIAQLIFRIVHEAANWPHLAPFRQAVLDESPALRRQLEKPMRDPSLRLGVSWNPKLGEQRIVQLTAVDRGSAADKSGLRVGDQILNFGGYPVDRFEDFRTLVLMVKNPVAVTIKRPSVEQPLELTVQLDGEPLRIGMTWRVDDAEPNCVIVRQVVSSSSADLAGLQINDRIYEVSGNMFTTSQQFYRLLTTLVSPMQLVIERNGRLDNLQLERLPRQ